jgi:hypothetical protein
MPANRLTAILLTQPSARPDALRPDPRSQTMLAGYSRVRPHQVIREQRG